METDWISILDLIKNSKFEASIITTFNAYLPFYEEVVLRKLISTGCRHNILMMDAGQFTECLQTPTERPSFAGYDYTLVPMKAKGVFHPKIIFLLGRRKGLLFVGSHNMTISGLGINKELTTKIEISDGKEKKGIQIAQEVWSYLKTWLDFQTGNIPEQIFNAFNLINNFSPWLTSNTDSESSDCKFLGSEPAGISLWEKLRERVPGPMKRVTVIGPFFDEKLGFLETLNADLSPKKIIVGIEPDTVQFTTKTYKIENMRIVDISDVFENKGVLHAKAIYFESEIGGKWLVTGSANPSSPAWTNSLNNRNAEAIILHEGSIATSTAKDLGITKLFKLPPISQEILDNVRKRTLLSKAQNIKKRSGTSSFIALSDGEKIILKSKLIDNLNFMKAECLNEHQEILHTTEQFEEANSLIMLKVPSDIINKIRFIHMSLKDDKSLFAIVHHDHKIMYQPPKTSQIQFRKYLEALNTDSPDIETLISIIEKVIFDEPVAEDSVVRRQKTVKDKKDDDNEIRIQFETLAVSLKDTAKEKRRKRMVTSGDIGQLIDILIYHLGIGLESKKPDTDFERKNEEEQVGTDDDEPDIEPVKLDLPKLIKICHNKVKRLVSRMISNFEKTAEVESGYTPCIIKLLAVLAMLRELRSIQRDGMLMGELIVPINERQRLFENSVKYLYGRNHMFLVKAKNELINETMDEISRLNALMLWLAYDCGADLYGIKKSCESPEDGKQRRFYKSNLLLFLSIAAEDDIAIEETTKSIYNTTRISRRHHCKIWLDNHVMAGKKFFNYQSKAINLNKKILEKNPILKVEPGKIAFLMGNNFPSLHLVLMSGEKVTIADIDGEDGKSTYPADQLIGLFCPKPIRNIDSTI